MEGGPRRRGREPADSNEGRVLVAKLALTDDEKQLLPTALENAIGISYDEYVSKVIAYLEPEHAAIYEERAQWNLMQETVVGHIEALR